MEVGDKYLTKSAQDSLNQSTGHKENRAIAGIDSGLAIFKPSRYEAGVKNLVRLDFHTLASIQRHKCIEFLIPESNGLYFILNKSTLKIKVKILTEDGSSPPKDDHVGFCNGLGFSLFKQVDCTLQQKSVGVDISTHYAYKGMLDCLLHTPAEYLTTYGMNFLFSKDTAHFMDSVSLAPTGGNEGLVKRHQYSAGGAEVQLHTPIYHDLFQIDEYLPSHMELRLRLWPNLDEFVIMSGVAEEQYRYEITECVLEMVGVEVTEPILRKHQALMSKTNAVFHYKASVLKSYSIPSNLSSWTIHHFLQNEIPTDLVICLVQTDGFIGDYKKNGYNFQTFGLNFLSLQCEGYQGQTFRPSYTNKQYVDPYRALYEPDHGYVPPFTPIINLQDFPGGYAIYRFKLGDDAQERLARPKHGLSRLVLNFADHLKNPITALVYARSHNVFEVDLARNLYIGGECQTIYQ